MEGVKGDPELEGVIPRSFHHIFDRISNAPEDERYLVRASYLEIYQEEIRDLLSKVKKFLKPFVLSVPWYFSLAHLPTKSRLKYLRYRQNKKFHEFL